MYYHLQGTFFEGIDMIKIRLSSVLLFLAIVTTPFTAFTQTRGKANETRVRTVSIPISVYTKEELRKDQAEEFVHVDRLVVRENKEEQQIISIRSVTDAPLSLAVLIQDDLTSDFNLKLKDIRKFIRSLPQGSRVMVAYLRGGTLQIRQKFTTDLEAAAEALRIVIGSSTVAPRNPYDGLIDTLNRFDALPAGRRAVLMVSDGLDASNGIDSSSPGMSNDLDRAVLRAQRKSVAVFTFYSPATLTESGNSRLVLNGQSSLLRLSEETGGRAFFTGTVAPVSFDPFFRDLTILLNRQFLLSYITTNMKRGYYRIEVESTNDAVTIEHPKGYYYR